MTGGSPATFLLYEILAQVGGLVKDNFGADNHLTDVPSIENLLERWSRERSIYYFAHNLTNRI